MSGGGGLCLCGDYLGVYGVSGVVLVIAVAMALAVAGGRWRVRRTGASTRARLSGPIKTELGRTEGALRHPTAVAPSPGGHRVETKGTDSAAAHCFG